MADPFNPYAEWLELPRDLAEPNHYQLLGLEAFESDPARIAKAAETAMNKVRSFRPGANARAWSKLLDELLLAKGKLLDGDRKREYDEELKELGTAEPPEKDALDSLPPMTTSAAPPTGEKRKFNPMFPPGMGPNVGLTGPESSPAESPPPATSKPVERPAAANLNPPAAAPKPAASAPAPKPAAPAPASAPPSYQPPTAPAPSAQPAPVAQAVPAAAWNSSAAQAPAAVQQGYGGQPAPLQHNPLQPAMGQQPMMQPGYAQPIQQGPMQNPMAAPVYPQAMQPGNYQPGMPAYGMPQQPYQQPTQSYQQPTYDYAQQPYAQPVAPYAQPQSPYGQPQSQYGQPQSQYGQPQSQYGQPQYPANQYGGMPYAQPAVPMAMPTAEPPLAGYGAHGGYGAAAPSYDPMAPVAMPVAVPATPAPAVPAAIPTGKAVAAPVRPVTAATEQPRNPMTSPIPTATGAGPLSAPASSPANSAYSASLAAAGQQNSSDKMVFWGAAVAVVMLVGAVGFAIVQANRRSAEAELAENPAPDVTPITPAVTPKVEPPKIKQPAIVTPPPVVMPPVVKPPEPPEVKKPVPEPAMPAPMPKPPEPKPEPTPMPIPTPPPPMPPPPTETKLTPVEAASLAKAMTTVRDALSERNFEEAEKQLEIAKQLARSPEQKAMLNRLKVLSEYVKQFERSIKTLMADPNFDAGAELLIGSSTRVVVVERSPETLVIRINGMNKSYSLNSLPEGLAMALINKRLDANDPVSKLVKGAYYAVSKNRSSDTDTKAKDLWAEATREGADAADLPQVLTDKYEFQ
ncbi:hypothetical protein ETAA8_09860 [Anatilimnocola aggregata]|uniref:Uncharacterized protein n=1 Tax=Anatilimnocola aggregata TaxID=2528021 RepID=A0A517Y6Q2_9BACT|nr:hypothetical protein [Anatilimnocola aggregata]QDU25914.1 hypothetical protein ETAA8_09860 [Anatilimnocola aggregata]